MRPSPRLFGAAIAAGALALTAAPAAHAAAAPAKPLTTTQLKAALLTAKDFGKGFTASKVQPVKNTVLAKMKTDRAACNTAIKQYESLFRSGWQAAFLGKGATMVANQTTTGDAARVKRMTATLRALTKHCHGVTADTGRVTRLALPKAGNGTYGLRVTETTDEGTFTLDLAIVQVKNGFGVVNNLTLGGRHNPALTKTALTRSAAKLARVTR
ncbi:hypothetical protein [Bailinhaonella thermotolerans]|uniref:Uncharacterized protein n=1 Tax=Bailinhaonella thermotolerans TaxID=1070861 RepID=A0A3A4BSA9_9ACTN|nr:hypothetical protein [Bailinhaonella thermotolerans]RJL34206.1 hypothetical protein D5H75_06970 [Bailinhaonella thermotolerans]